MRGKKQGTGWRATEARQCVGMKAKRKNEKEQAGEPRSMC